MAVGHESRLGFAGGHVAVAIGALIPFPFDAMTSNRHIDLLKTGHVRQCVRVFEERVRPRPPTSLEHAGTRGPLDIQSTPRSDDGKPIASWVRCLSNRFVQLGTSSHLRRGQSEPSERHDPCIPSRSSSASPCNRGGREALACPQRTHRLPTCQWGLLSMQAASLRARSTSTSSTWHRRDSVRIFEEGVRPRHPTSLERNPRHPGSALRPQYPEIQ